MPPRQLAGRTIRLRFFLRSANIYAVTVSDCPSWDTYQIEAGRAGWHGLEMMSRGDFSWIREGITKAGNGMSSVLRMEINQRGMKSSVISAAVDWVESVSSLKLPRRADRGLQELMDRNNEAQLNLTEHAEFVRPETTCGNSCLTPSCQTWPRWSRILVAVRA
jgi:hypothetical protein